MQYAVSCIRPSAARALRPEKKGAVHSSGASPRATINLIEGARALAFLRSRNYVLPEDVIDLVPDVLRHRLVLSYEALSDGLTADQIVMRVLQAIPAPDKPLEAHVRVAAAS